MDLTIVLDFDGVLFNSAFEAYSVCNEATFEDKRFNQKVAFEDFLDFRSYVTDAWQYRHLYDLTCKGRPYSSIVTAAPNEEDWAFAESFFAARKRMMEDSDWPKVMSPYDFFFLLKPLLNAHPEYFHVLSTRDVTSISRTLKFYGVGGIPVYGQENIRSAGSKIEVARDIGWLDDGKKLVVYVDDMSRHLEPFEGKVHLPLHADWGYDRNAASSLNQHQVLAIIKSMIKLTANGSAKI